MKHFKKIKLPIKKAVRRSYVMAQIAPRATVFASLLRELSPRDYSALLAAGARPFDYCKALYAYCDAYLFPMQECEFEWFMDDFEGDEPTEADLLRVAENEGIRIWLLGADDEGLTYDNSSPALSFAFWMADNPPRQRLAEVNKFSGLKGGFSSIDALREFENVSLAARFYKPPRGRVWLEPWDQIETLMAYIDHSTGHWFMDESNFYLAEIGADFAPWNMPNIQHIARGYAEAKPVYDKLMTLVEYLDEKPTERLPLLGHLLTGNADVRSKLSKSKHVKTLAELFTESDAKVRVAGVL